MTGMRPAGRRGIVAVAALVLGCAAASESPAPYVFAWPFLEKPLEPRGGTTRGAEVTLDAGPSEAWRRLQAAKNGRERDRAAILAMAGDYRVSFDFLETVLFEPGAEPARPYRSWATERIYVVEERGDFISLQHILVMFVVDDAGRRQGPFVQKHWRQDWRYEPESLLAFAGDERFETRPVSRKERAGAWSQSVYQVDDAPRYASLGRWRHAAEASLWEGGDVWRPLPRREHSVRDDYQVLAGRNRLSILSNGWVHEQNNRKLVLQGGRLESRPTRSEPKASEGGPLHGNGSETRRVAHEIGVDRYERIVGFDFEAADAYWRATAPFWQLVREGWAQRVAAQPRFRIRGECGGEEAFVPFFRYAGRLEAGDTPSEAEQRAEIERVLDCVVSAD